MSPLRLLGFEMPCLAGAWLMLLAHRLTTGRIKLRGLLGSGGGLAGLQAERVQLLVVTVMLSARIVALLAMDDSGAMPGVGLGWLALFAVSCAWFVLGTWRRISRRGPQRHV